MPPGTTFPLAFVNANGVVFMFIRDPANPRSQDNLSLTGAYVGTAAGFYRLYGLGQSYTELAKDIVGFQMDFGDYAVPGLKGHAAVDGGSGNLFVTCGRDDIAPKPFMPMLAPVAAQFEAALISGQIAIHPLPDVRRPIILYKDPNSEEYFYIDRDYFGDPSDDALSIGASGHLTRIELSKVVPRECATCIPDIYTKAGGVLSKGKWQASPDAPPVALEQVNYYAPLPPGVLSGEMDGPNHQIDYGPIINAEHYYSHSHQSPPLDASVFEKMGIDLTQFAVPALHTPCNP